MKLYDYSSAARLLGLSGRAGVFKRLKSLEKQGAGLTEENGGLLRVGERFLITESGLARLESFTPRRPTGRPSGTGKKKV